jgi:hypothetical protein
MATVANLLDLLLLIDNELDVASGGRDEVSAILALRQAQHYFELLAARYPRVLQDVTTVSTAANTESSTWASALRRLDALWYLDVDGNPVREIVRIDEIGGHVPSLPWPIEVSLTATAGGAPFGYYANMAQFYWLPKPDAVYTLRIYGFLKKATFSARTDAFLYPDEVQLSFASFADKLLKVGVDDDTVEMDKLSAQLFTPILKTYKRFDRSKPTGRTYSEFHST